jgi:hypothetical protein
VYPAKLSLTALICITGTVECTIVALAFERGSAAAWSVHLDAKFLASVYAVRNSPLNYFSVIYYWVYTHRRSLHYREYSLA